MGGSNQICTQIEGDFELMRRTLMLPYPALPEEYVERLLASQAADFEKESLCHFWGTQANR